MSETDAELVERAEVLGAAWLCEDDISRLAAIARRGLERKPAGEPEIPPEVEAAARRIAARKMLLSDPAGAKLPDDLWRQAVPDARAALNWP